MATNDYELSTNGQLLIQRFEGLRLKSYQDLTGIWTIGWGHTGPDIKANLIISPKQAHDYLMSDAKAAGDIIRANVTAQLSQQQYDALVSFVFNIGPGHVGTKDGFVWLKSGHHSTLLELLNADQMTKAAEQILQWNKAGGKSVYGLSVRRQAERRLFLTGQIRPV